MQVKGKFIVRNMRNVECLMQGFYKYINPNNTMILRGKEVEVELNFDETPEIDLIVAMIYCDIVEFNFFPENKQRNSQIKTRVRFTSRKNAECLVRTFFRNLDPNNGICIQGNEAEIELNFDGEPNAEIIEQIKHCNIIEFKFSPIKYECKEEKIETKNEPLKTKNDLVHLIKENSWNFNEKIDAIIIRWLGAELYADFIIKYMEIMLNSTTEGNTDKKKMNVELKKEFSDYTQKRAEVNKFISMKFSEPMSIYKIVKEIIKAYNL